MITYVITYNQVKRLHIERVVNNMATENYSELYDTIEEAQNDYDNDISYVWSLDGQIVECIDG